MSMYKTIFWSEAYEDYASGDQVSSVSGEVLVFGESAFASLDEAVAYANGTLGGNAIVVKVASGKYDGFTIVNEGVTISDVKVTAVDFDGGEVMIGGEIVNVAGSGFDAEAQAVIIDGLNEINAADGNIYVAEKYAPTDVHTMYIGSGNANAVVGATDTVITGNDFEEVVNVLNNMNQPVEAAATTEVTSGQNIYFDKNTSSNYVFKAGSTAHNELSKWDMTYNVTIEAGAQLVAGRNNADAIAANTPQNAHIKSTLTLDGTADNKAVLNFLSATRQDASMSVLYNGKLDADNATISVADFGCVGTATITNSTIFAEGSLGFGAHDSQTGSVISLTNSTVTALGHNRIGDGTYYANNSNRIANLVMDNSTITIDDNSDDTVADTVQLGYYYEKKNFLWTTKYEKPLTLKNGSKIIIESGTAATALWDVTVENSTIEAGDLSIVDGVFAVKGKSTIDIADLTIAEGKTLTMDSSSILKLDSLSGEGNIKINLLDGFKEGDVIVDFKKNDATEAMLSKIQFSNSAYEAGLNSEGDIVIEKASVKIENNTLDLSKDDSFTKEGATLGSAENDLTIETGAKENTAVTDKAEIKSDIIGNNITLNNSKNLAVTGSIEAENNLIITNSGNNSDDNEAVLNGGYDAEGNELAATITSKGNITMTNDGHAAVDMTGKNIDIANNSVNTLTGDITAEENIEITADEVVVDGVAQSGEGAIKDASLTAKQVSIADQTATDTDFNTSTLKVYGTSELGAGNTYSGNIIFGDKENSADATLDVSGVDGGIITVQNATVDLTGTMGAENYNATIDVGGYLSAGVGAKDAEMGAATVNVAEGAVVKANQIHVGSNDSVNTHTLNVYGQVDTIASVYVKPTGAANIYGQMTVAQADNPKNFQAAGKVTVSGKDASLTVYGQDAYGIKIGTDEAGKRGNLTIVNGGTVDVNTKLEVGYSTNRHGDLEVKGGTLKAGEVVIQDGSNFTVSGESTLDIAKASGKNIAVDGEATLKGSTINGVSLDVAYGESKENSSLTLLGNNTLSSLWIGGTGSLQVGEAGDDKQRNTADVSVGNFYVRPGGAEVNVDNASMKVTSYGNWKSSLTANNAYIGAHNDIYVYDNNNAGLLTWELNDSELNIKSGYDVSIGGKDGIAPNGNATLILNNSSITGGAKLNIAGAGDVSDDGVYQYTANGSSMEINNSTVDLATLNIGDGGSVTVSGESELDIDTVSGSSIDLLDGAIIKDSTVGGSAFVAGNVTFRGDNTFSMITDFGNLTDYYGTTAPMQWTVEEGASLTLTKEARYGLGYGDKVVVNGTISAGGASDARATLTDDNAENDVKQSLFMHGLVAQENKGWDENSSMTVNNAYVTIGSNNSFGNKPGNYGGTYTFNFNNTVLDSSRITFYEALSQTSFTFKDSDVKTGTFMTRDADSVFTLDNTKLVSTTATNGTDEGNYNAGTLNITNGSDITYTAQLVNEGGSINVADSTFTANGGVKNNATFNVSGNSELNGAFTGNAVKFAEGTVLTSTDGASFEAAHTVSEAMTFGQGDFDFQSSLMGYGKLDFAEGADVSAAATLAFYAGGEVASNATVTGNSIYVNGGDVTVSGNMTAKGGDGGLLLRANGKNFNVTGGNVNVAYIEGTRGTVSVNLEDATVAGGHHITDNGGTLNWNIDNSTVTARNWSGNGDIVLNDSAIVLSDTLTIAGTLTVNGNSSVTAKSVVNNGTISLNVTDDILAAITTDSYTVINQTGSGAALDLKVNYNGTEYGVGESITINGIDYSITAGDGNDIAIEASAKTLIVDPTYTEETPGYGFDKFSSFAEALQAAAENTEVQVIKVAGDIDEEIMPTDVEFLVNQDVVITADKPVSINLKNNGTSYDIILGANADASGSKITFDENISLTLNDRLIWAGYYGNNADVEIKGEVSASQWWNGADTTVKAGGKLSTTGEALIFRRGATLTIEGNAAQGAAAEDREVQLDANYLNFLSGNLIATDTRIESGAVWVANTGSYTNESSVWINLDNTILNSTGNLKLNSDATALMIVENGSTLNVTNFDGYGASEIGANGSLWVYDSTANLKDVNNAGDIDIADSTFNVNGTLNNTGIFNVSGESTLKVNKLVGTMNVADATINDGSFIGGKAGSIDISGDEVNFDGNVTIDAAVNSNKSEDATTININEGAVVNINGKEYDKYNGGVNLGATDTLNVDGTLNVNQGDNFYLKATTNVAGELNVTDAGFQNTSGKLTVTGKMNVTDTFADGAYQNVKLAGNDNASATGSLDVDGGTLSIDAPSFAFGGGYKSSGWVDVTSADVTVQNGGKITSNAVVFRNGTNSTMTLDNGTFEFTQAADFGTVHSTLGTGVDNFGKIIAQNGSTLDFGDRTFTNEGEVSVNASALNGGTIDNKGTFTADNATITLDRFEQNSTTGAVLNNVDLNVGYFYNGAQGGAYAVIGGESKLQIDNGSGYFALRLADDTTLLDGTNVTGQLSLRTQGDVTFGKEATDFIHVDSFDTRDSYDFDKANSQTITVNGTLDIAATGKGYSTYWMGIYGSVNADDASVATTLTGNGTINSNTAAILQYGKIVVDEGLTINITDQYAADMRFTLTDLTIKGEINSIGSNNKLNAIQTSTVTVTGENAALNVDSYLLVGYQTYKGSNDTTDKYKSTVTVEDGADLTVGGTLYINKDSSIMIDADSTFSAGSIINYGGMINSTTEGEIVLNQDLTTGSITTDTLTLNAGAALSAGSISVNNLNLAIGSELTLGSGNSSVAADHITVTGKLVPENAEFTLVASGWVGALAGKNVWYDVNADGTIADDEKFTVQTGIEDLSGLNFVTKDGNLYVKDFGAETTGIYIGDLSGAVDGKITTPDGATYTVGEDAFATVEDAKATLGDQVSDVTTIALKSDDDIDAAIAAMPSVETVTIEDYAVIDVNGGDLIIRNDGHLDTTITAADSMEITNTSVNTLLGTYSADVEINVNNAGGMIGTGTYGVEESTKFNTSTLTVNDGDAANVEVNADALELNNTNTFGMNADSGILSGGAWGSGYITLNGSANMSIDGDITDTDVNIDSDLEDHTGTLTLNGNQTFSGDISANKIVIAGDKEVTFNENTVDFNELNVSGTLNADFTAMASNSDAGALTGAGTLNTTHAGAWIVNDSVTRDVSGFTGTVTMENADASIVLGNGDFDSAASAEDSYFSADATVAVNGNQKVVLAGDGVNTATTYTGNGTINVGEYDGAFAEQSEDFNQTLSGANTGFTGTVNVSEGAQLKIENALGADSINMDNETTQSATDVATEFDTQLILNQAGLDLAAQVTGDANDIIDVAQNATLSTAEALNYFEGTVKVNANTLSIDGANETAAKFTGTGIIDANADQILTADGAINDFSGTVDLGSSKLTLDGTNNTYAVFKSESTNAHLTLNADQTFNAAGAIDQLESRIVLGGNDLTLNGENTFSSSITGTTDSNLNLNADLTLDRSGMALYQYEGTVNVNDNTLTVTGTENTKAKFTGTTDADISWYAGIMASDGALNEFDGHITVGNELTLQGTNDTKATFETDEKIIIKANNTFSTDGAINDVTGTIQLWGNTLTLEGENTTSATLKSYDTGVLDADANQTFSGDVSEFSGLYDIAAGSSVTLSGTIADVINAKGDTLNLTNTTGMDITVNAGTGSELKNLAFGANNVVLGAGDGDDFTNVIGTGDIKDFGNDQTFGTVEAGTIFVTGSQDELTIEDLKANINITIDAAQAAGDESDVTIGNDDFAGSISVTLEDSDYLATSYKIATNGSFTSDTTITLTVGSNAAKTLKVDGREILDGESYLLKLKEDTLILSKLPGYSNYVVVDGDWKDQEPYESVMDGTTERYVGYDAAHDLTDAVEYIRGYDKGVNANAGTNMGDATIELTEGKYTLADGKYLMNGTNEVTQLTMNGRDGETATLSGVVVASDGTAETTLNVNNVRVQGELYGGGTVIINNDADLRSSGNVIAAGAKDSDMANDSSLVLNGGYFGNRVIAGGSVNTVAGKTITVDGNSSLVIDNQSTTDKMVITGNVVGGSWAAEGEVVQNGTAEILVNVENATQIRGNIFVNGGEGNGTLTMNGDSKITFTGDADLLTFTGTVNATNGTDTTEAVIFDNFEGEFNGSFAGFDVITIEGSTTLELGRRQNKTGDTAISFVVNSDSANNDAMYTVRDANNWEFAEVISVTVDSTTASGEYVLVDNYNGGFEDFTFTLNGQAYTLGDAVESNVIKVVDDQLILSVYDSNTNLVGNTTEQVVIDSTVAGKETQIVGDVVDNATTNSSAAVKITTDDAVISNTGTITGAETQKSVAIEIQSGTSDAVVDNSGTITAADVAKYNRAIYSEGKDLAVSNSGTINGEIYQNAYGAKSLDVENSGTITAMTSDMGSNSVISSSNGIINLTGDGGTYELAANTETGKFNGEIVEGQHGIAISASNTTFKAGTDVTVGNGSVKGLYNDSGKNIVISGDNNTIAIVGRRSATGIEEYSYEGQSDVVISGDNNTISVTSASGATGISGRNGAVVITGSGTEINVTSTGSYAYGIETKDVKDYSGDVIIGEFNADGSVAQASDIQITVDGQVSTNSNPVMAPIGVYAKKGTAQIALAEDGKIECESFTAVSAEKVQITNAGTIIGDVIATGSATDDAISMDVDAVLNGTVTGVDTLDVTGLEDVVAAGNVAGAKTIVGEVDDVLAGAATIDGKTLTSGKVQLAGADTVDTADDIWASLTKNADNSLTVAWGRTETEMADALDAFKADNTLAIGDAVVATATTLDDSDSTNDFSKKNNGTLA